MTNTSPTTAGPATAGAATAGPATAGPVTARSADPNHRDLTRAATGVLADFNASGELTPADIHVATHIVTLTGEETQPALLAAALTVRAVRSGSVCLDLDTLPRGPSDPAASAWETPAQAWPEVDWATALAESPLLAGAQLAGDPAPLRLDGTRLYLDRYWQEETQVLNDLLTRLGSARLPEPAQLQDSLRGYFPGDGYEDQREAAELVARSRTAVITGGPGTGKTTTVARLLGMLFDGEAHLRVALAAPTGKAAARMVEALAGATGHENFPPEHRERIGQLPSTTIHRLLGYLPGNRFRHNRTNPLPYDLVVIDETSMVPLTLMARLLEALRPGSRLVLVGDAHQLASVEAGAVLGDLVDGLEEFTPRPVASLTHSRRFGEGIHALAEAVRTGQADTAAELIFPAPEAAGEPEKITEPEETSTPGPPPPPVGNLDEAQLLGALLPGVRALHAAAASGDAAAALVAAENQRLLCAHRDGPHGVSEWNRRITAALAAALGIHLGRWFPGKPLLVTRNDYAMRLFNGDTGVVIHRDGRLVAAFAEPGGIREISLSRLNDVVEAHAMTVHRSQGSQFRDVYVLLPQESSKILTRELLYTALTRAQQRVRVIGDRGVVVAAIHRHAGRASGLAARLHQARAQ